MRTKEESKSFNMKRRQRRDEDNIEDRKRGTIMLRWWWIFRYVSVQTKI